MISVILPYYNRRNILIRTLHEYTAYNTDDVEFIIVDDASDTSQSINDVPAMFPTLNIKLIVISNEDKSWLLPIVPLNIGINATIGDKIIITNPECILAGDIFKYVRDGLTDNNYFVFGCYSIDRALTQQLLESDISTILHTLPLDCQPINLKEGENWWYQHSKFRNYGYNFCTAICKTDMVRLDGFDDRYAMGMGYGDDDFIMRVKRADLTIHSIDDPYVLHMNHYDNYDFLYLASVAGIRNKQLFMTASTESSITATKLFNNIYKKYGS